MKKQAHGATCRSCRAAGDSLGKHSARPPQRRLPSFVPRRTRFVIFKAEHRQETQRVGCTPRASRVSAILFFADLSILMTVFPRINSRLYTYPPFRSSYSFLYTFSRFCRGPTPARKRILTLSESLATRNKAQ